MAQSIIVRGRCIVLGYMVYATSRSVSNLVSSFHPLYLDGSEMLVDSLPPVFSTANSGRLERTSLASTGATKTDPPTNHVAPLYTAEVVKLPLIWTNTPVTTGPAQKPNDDTVNTMPRREPNSLTGETVAVDAATRVSHAPDPIPYASRPTTTAPAGRWVGVQNAKREIDETKAAATKTFHDPSRSARMPARTRPTKDPSWRIVRAYCDTAEGALLFCA